MNHELAISPPDPAASRRLELLIFAADGVACVPLPASGTIVLGRADDCDVRIDDPSVSRRHAALHLGSPLRIEDLGSANGVRLRRPLDGAVTVRILESCLQRGKPAEIEIGEPVNLGSVLVTIRRVAPALGEHVVRAPAMERLHAMCGRVAAGNISVLLLGETGAGKEVLAETIHRSSPRAARPFVCLNCAALSEQLLESELFGHEKGAFSGAVRTKPGLLESADGGTVFLDEAGELPPSLQVKLLRVLEDRKVTRVGGLTPRTIDVRFVSATNRDLAARVREGAFRQDLFFRLAGVTLSIPPLRERPEEIAPLAALFAARAAVALGRSRPPEISSEALAALGRHAWPGNVRELRNVMDRAVVLGDGDAIRPEHLLLEAAAPAEEVFDGETLDLGEELASVERRRIVEALKRCAGNQTQAAAALGMPRRTFLDRLDAHGIARPRRRATPPPRAAS